MRQEIAVVSLNGFIHCWNAVRMKQVMSKRLPHTMENVCLSTDEDCQMYAVGSKVSAQSTPTGAGVDINIVLLRPTLTCWTAERCSLSARSHLATPGAASAACLSRGTSSPSGPGSA